MSGVIDAQGREAGARSPRELLAGLLDYIDEQAKGVNLHDYQLSECKGFVRFHYELSGLPGLEFDVRPEGDHIWLRIARLEVCPPPLVPEEYRELFVVNQDPASAQAPFINESVFPIWMDRHLGSHDHMTHQSGSVELADVQHRQAVLLEQVEVGLREYVALWVAWAVGEEPRRRSIALYTDLFFLKHQMGALETARPMELVWGIGVASWLLSCGEKRVRFEYPLLTQAVELSLDEQTMAMEVRPRTTGTRVEMGMVAACSVPGAAEVEVAMREQLQQHGAAVVTPFDASGYADLLKLAATNLDGNGVYREVLASGEQVAAAGDDLVVTDAWVILSRPRTNNFLTDDLKRLKLELERGCAIPAGPMALVTSPSDEQVLYEPVRFRGLSSRGSQSGPVQELFFPLPYNEEQVTIIQRLEQAAGVTVQGPPGTGKTHTIANVICHYLATGRRVLVTSRGEQALEVLQSKIPEEVRALTVALLSSDRDGVRQFQGSIQAIQHRVSQLQPEQTANEIAEYHATIEQTHQKLARIDRRLDELAELQLSDVDVDGVPMCARKLAELLLSEGERFAWFDDKLSLAQEHASPLTEEDVAVLRNARRRVGQDLAYLDARIPVADALPSSGSVAELHAMLLAIQAIEEDVERGELPELLATTTEVLDAAAELLEGVNGALLLLMELEQCDAPWVVLLRKQCRLVSFAAEREAFEALFGDIDKLVSARASFLQRPVIFPEEGFGSQKVRDAVARAVETGKPFGLVSFGTAEAKAQIAEVRVSGLVPASRDDWEHVRRFLMLHDEVVSFVSRWNHCAESLSLPLLEEGIARLRTIEEHSAVARRAYRMARTFDSLLPQQAERVFRTVPVGALCGGSLTELRMVGAQLRRHLSRRDLTVAATRLSHLKENLAGMSGAVSEQLREFVDESLGNPALTAETVVTGYSRLVERLRHLASLSDDFARIRETAERIARAGASGLAMRLCSEPALQSGGDQVMPVNWRDAWNRARVRGYLDGIEARDEILKLVAQRQDLETGLSRYYKSLVASSAWLSTYRNATPRVMQALAGYATAIRRIGKGTGPNAVRYRRDAQESMIDAAAAVPCWIMSHARVSESIPPHVGAFDLVVVDEASQSDLWALPAILRGKKILVVGDDKQVSPDGGFLSSQRIEELKRRFLTTQPYGVEMTPEKSLYDLAIRVFAAEQVMLREHFRCVSPIISYSNRLFYRGFIQPLRIPTALERIDPPLVDLYVPDGLRDGGECNLLEAEAIAEEIDAILANKALADRTIGVVSLLGIEQAKYIDTLVRKRLPVSELLHRRFLCGDARTFQGSERDIMFLSMVVDRRQCKALSGNVYEQRFNVAASRARDRLYLVHSVTGEMLSEKDLRQSLLAHFNNPLGTDSDETGVLLIDRCESNFEREVFSRLVSCGYRVFPQVKTGAYRIDMVVEGAGEQRLAIELDGDAYHGPERWLADMHRQRVLERAGWVFWRCFASTWLLHQEEVFAELAGRLSSMGIEPAGALDHVPELVEKRRWVSPDGGTSLFSSLST